MRKPELAAPAARQASLPAGREQAGVQLVCCALMLSLIALSLRILSVW
jgi:hypothetical protein